VRPFSASVFDSTVERTPDDWQRHNAIERACVLSLRAPASTGRTRRSR
jgi:hypothetical protein